jgi:hypothetical protein
MLREIDMRRCDRAGSRTKIARHFKETPRTFAIDPISDSTVVGARAAVPGIKN